MYNIIHLTPMYISTLLIHIYSHLQCRSYTPILHPSAPIYTPIHPSTLFYTLIYIRKLSYIYLKPISNTSPNHFLPPLISYLLVRN